MCACTHTHSLSHALSLSLAFSLSRALSSLHGQHSVSGIASVTERETTNTHAHAQAHERVNTSIAAGVRAEHLNKSRCYGEHSLQLPPTNTRTHTHSSTDDRHSSPLGDGNT